MPVWLILLPIAIGGVPGTADVAVNAQFAAIIRYIGVAGGVGVEAGCFGAPPHPERRTAAETTKMIANHFMDFVLTRDTGSFFLAAPTFNGRRTAHTETVGRLGRNVKTERL